MEDVINAFYEAFKAKDGDKMASFYHEEIEFTDPAFGTLKGERAKNMWRMLTQNARDLEVETSNISCSEDKGTAHWEAKYTFSQSGRSVHNKIDAQFEFKDGKIIRHIDTFNLHKWAKQALGFKGWLIGGTSFFKKKLNAQTNRLLDKFEKQNG